MNHLEKYSDEELFNILDSDVKEEIKSRGYEYGWHKKVQYAGVIYILVNPAFPNLVKIGYADNVEARLKALNRNSGLPDPFYVYATYFVKKRLEDLKLHSLIDSLDSDLRHSKNREFYEMSPEKAYNILLAIAEINGSEDLLIRYDASFDEKSKVSEKDNVKNNKVNLVKEGIHKKVPLTFKMLSIPVGSELVYYKDKSIRVTTVDDKNLVMYKGKKYTLSGVVTHLKKGGSWQGGCHFLFNGIKLTDLRKQLGL